MKPHHFLQKLHSIISSLATKIPNDPIGCNDKAIPLFNCCGWNSDSYANHVFHCFVSKLLLMADLLVMGLLIHQVYIYVYSHKIGFKELRVWIFIACICGCINTFLHYGVFDRNLKSNTIVIIEIFRTSIFFLICLYFALRAQSLLKFKRKCISAIGIMYFTVFSMNIILAIVINVEIVDYNTSIAKGNNVIRGLNPLNLCSSIEF